MEVCSVQHDGEVLLHRNRQAAPEEGQGRGFRDTTKSAALGHHASAAFSSAPWVICRMTRSHWEIRRSWTNNAGLTARAIRSALAS